MDLIVESAKKQIEGRVDRILDVISMRDFVEFVTITGGAVCTYKVYNDGTVTEK